MKEDGKLDVRLPLYTQVVRLIELERHAWWAVAARSALLSGRAALHSTRDDANKLLFARFWLTPPRVGSSGRLDSGDSVLLHVLASPDSGALHSHPWDFTTTILNGWYSERLPTKDWQDEYSGSWIRGEKITATLMTGPETTELRHVRVGQTIHHKATDIHSIAEVGEGTWTLVRTGPKERPWGFFPAGQPWIPYDQYLNPDDTMVMA